MPPVTILPDCKNPEQEWSVDTTGGTAPAQPPRELYQRLKLVAGLLKDAGKLPKPGNYLLWRDASGAVQSSFLDRPMVIGRAPTCDLVLDGPTVSRRHCRISPGTLSTVIEDLDSTHGTKVGSTIHQPQVLRNGDVIEAGGTALAFVTNLEIETPHA